MGDALSLDAARTLPGVCCGTCRQKRHKFWFGKDWQQGDGCPCCWTHDAYDALVAGGDDDPESVVIGPVTSGAMVFHGTTSSGQMKSEPLPLGGLRESEKHGLEID